MAKATKGQRIDQVHQRKELKNVAQKTESGEGWTIHLGDSVQIIKSVPDKSIDYTIFSPPFSSLYIYSDSLADMGNCSSDEEFFKHFGYLVPELYRVTVPGRLCTVHCKDLPLYKGRDGEAGLKDFPGAIVRVFEQSGWTFHSRCTIWKCPVIERERTNNNGLLHKTIKRDSSQVRQGMADYLLTFRRFPDAGLMSDKPIERPMGIDTYVGTCDPREESSQVMVGNHEKNHPSKFARHPSNDPALAVWQRYAEPVWWDIDQMNVLNYGAARDGQDERHICPLQLDVIQRAVELWTNPGDLVFSPFAGIGSEGYSSLLAKRKFVGVELKESYWKQAQKNLTVAADKARQKSLFESE